MRAPRAPFPTLLVRSLICLGLSAAVLVPLATGAQENPQGSGFVDRVTVDVVNVPVFITDRQGNWVTGLTAEDFVILEDGKRVEITNFYAAEGMATAPSGQTVDRSPHRRTANLLPTPTPAQRPLNLIVFVDNVHMEPRNRSVVVDSLRNSFRSRLRSPHRVMIAAQGSKLEIVQPFTDQLTEIEAGLDRLESYVYTKPPSETDDLLSLTEVANDDLNTKHMVSTSIGLLRHLPAGLQKELETAHAGVLSTLDHLNVVARAVSLLPGRKALLYISDDLPEELGTGELVGTRQRARDLAASGTEGRQMTDVEMLSVTSSVSGSQLLERPGINREIDDLNRVRPIDVSPRFRATAAIANSSGVTLYLVKGAALAKSSSSGNLATRKTRGRGARSSHDRLREVRLRSSNTLLADATGGLTFWREEQLREWVRDSLSDRTYWYSVGYRPPSAPDGKAHKIKVKVKRRGVTLRHRRSYIHHPPDQPRTDRVVSALLLGLELNPHRIRLELSSVRRRPDGSYLKPLTLQLPVREVSFVESGGEFTATLKLIIAVRDPAGRWKGLREFPVPIAFPADRMEALGNQSQPLGLDLPVEPGRSLLAVALWQDDFEKTSLLQREFVVGQE